MVTKRGGWPRSCSQVSHQRRNSVWSRRCARSSNSWSIVGARKTGAHRMDERRYYGLDALRGAMMMLGIVLHAATLYLAAPPPHVPLTTDRNTSLTMDAIFDLIHSFRMPCFFVLAGFFASLLVEKRGVWETYRNRAARILAPLLAGMVTVLPI